MVTNRPFRTDRVEQGVTSRIPYTKPSITELEVRYATFALIVRPSAKLILSKSFVRT